MRPLKPGRRSFCTVETSNAGEPEVIEPRTTRLVDEDILLRWELRLPPEQGLTEKETETHSFQISVHDLKGVQV